MMLRPGMLLGFAALSASGMLASIWLEHWHAALVGGLWAVSFVYLAWAARGVK